VVLEQLGPDDYVAFIPDHHKSKLVPDQQRRKYHESDLKLDPQTSQVGPEVVGLVTIAQVHLVA